MSEKEGLFVVRYSEIGLKGQNRAWFEERLAKNLRESLGASGVGRVERIRGRILVRHAGTAEGRIAARLAETPGVRSFSAARAVERTYAAIEAAAVGVFLERRRAAERPGVTFGVRTERADKSFPMISTEISASVGAAILRAAPDVRVDLGAPEIEIKIEVHRDRAFVMGDWRAGPGGLPAGASGRVVLLLSGGIDSPVAGHLLSRRGCEILPVYFHSFPFTGDAAKEKVIDLARLLSRPQRALDLHIVPFTEAQAALREACRADLLVVLYRRMMLRVAERIADLSGALALATGESVGQVASQTLPNMRAIDLAAQRPVLRPLCGMDKEETIRIAKAIGTYEISIRPAEDCCSLFVPKHPATRARPEEVAREEAKLDIEALARACAENVEKLRFRWGERAE